MKRDMYLFMPSYSLSPSQLSSFNQVFIRDYENEELKPIQSRGKFSIISKKYNNGNSSIVRKFHNFKISTNAYRTLKKKINWLYYLAKSKSITTYNGKKIYNFKIAFITLTLSSKQKQPTQEITNTMFNQFLTEIRQRTKMENYVWRLEFQKNGNVHYHLCTDTYIDYFFVLKIWNRIQSNYGYIQEYQDKHKSLSFSDYCKIYNSENKVDKNVMAKRFAKGCKEKWSNPNSVDVKSVISKKAIAFYISKYFAKDDDNKKIKNELDNEENSSSLRLWFCSRSLSKLKSIVDFSELMEVDLFGIISSIKDVVCKIKRYATTYYFDIFKLVGKDRKVIEMILKNYAFGLNYVPSG